MKRLSWNHKLPTATIREIKRRAKTSGQYEWQVVRDAFEVNPCVKIYGSNGEEFAKGKDGVFRAPSMAQEERAAINPLPHQKHGWFPSVVLYPFYNPKNRIINNGQSKK